MRIFWVDSFSTRVGEGNPAAVIPLGSSAFPSDATCQRIAFENGLSETAFYRETGTPGRFHLRWFTPELEVDLCGHATLAAGFVALAADEASASAARDAVVFDTLSGALEVRRRGAREFELVFPSRPPAPAPDAPDALFEALGLPRGDALFVGKARDYLIEVATPAQVLALAPDARRLARVDALCVIVSARTLASAPGGPHVVSRVWCPACGVPEDPVTGSAHCTVVPYFCALLKTDALVCRQASARGGTLACRLVRDADGAERVCLAGAAVLYMVGEIRASGAEMVY
jgi:PhzF family phenazine biosynthesis protein